jgi:hypothetical protein
MKCESCGKEAVRIVYNNGVEYCENCSGIKASGGAKIDSILTRQSLRVRSQSYKFEGDTLPPHRYDKAKKKWVANEEFIKNNPENVHNFLFVDELKEAGFNKLIKGKKN